MAQSQAKRQFYVMAYGLGASVVILGALFKILHFQIGFLTGGFMLSIGMGVEALIFALSAFEPADKEYEWDLVYPELSQGIARAKDQPKDVEGLLAQKLDKILVDAKLDAELVGKLTASIKNFQSASLSVAPVIESIAATNSYSVQLNIASTQMESLNNLYKSQLETSAKQAEINEAIVENASKMKEQMESLATNLSSLNGIYGGMLSAMSNSRK
ncbi:MAG: gliding motility protein GldL [Flavobacteriales bacterium CG_4_9_14_0_2_um_filter_35_242]|nr:gliding motility protein GldL [Zetaproteobacteria bacterium]NDK18383.1 gliding motility protein GldL [Flavobacteriales bacterium]OIO08754.1 MAG: gliding motility protein GldL [Flavobacteriaceae bacterium CG1_02_35_72]PIV19246.1 MAG: gliding motility protein GldL [Flavobacteriales bacterium CG03_land_8_20_14_0_80_35_15]PJA04763.1 MAG: gliding motility protein GldL [Flavobacteriales bacterium CG_4_10_14_0_2_um_filter_35_18]PJC59675.1 MAG: gliding motility protein GldL [Flavobacteriales bacter